MAVGRRRRGRILAMQALFAADLSGHPVQEALDQRLEDTPSTPFAADYARALTSGVLQHRDAIDDLIARAAPQFPVSDLPPVVREILRVAVYEFHFGGDVPLQVAVNEAVEIAKEFGSASSPRFINGVLGAISRSATITTADAEAVASEESAAPDIADIATDEP